MRITGLISQFFRAVAAPATIRSLARSDNPMAAALGEALLEVVPSSLGPDEKEAIEAIEALRAEYMASDRQIQRLDFGAGQPDDARSQEQQREGILVTDSLSRIARSACKSPFWALVLFKLVRHTHPAVALELGAAIGMSGAYQASALRLNGAGRLTTLEGDWTVAGIARESFERLGLGNVEVVEGRFDATLGPVLERRAPVDFVFIDGHHDETATLRYFEAIVPHLGDAAVLVFDDIRWNAGMERAWTRISKDPRVRCAVHLGTLGVCVLGGAPVPGSPFHVPLQVFARRYNRARRHGPPAGGAA